MRREGVWGGEVGGDKKGRGACKRGRELLGVLVLSCMVCCGLVEAGRRGLERGSVYVLQLGRG